MLKLKKILIPFFLVTSFAVHSGEAVVPAKVFHLISKSELGAINCSATLLKFDGKCSLLTNAHCVQKGQASYELKVHADHPESYEKKKSEQGSMINIDKLTGFHLEKNLANFANGNNAEFSYRNEVKLKSIDRVQDIALLDAPMDLMNKYCPLVEEVDLSRTTEDLVVNRHYNTLSNYGYTEDKATVRYSSNSNWNLHQGRSTLRLKAMAPGKHLLEATNLEIHPGMSGGLSIDDKGRVMGLLVRYIPFQQTSYIIPIEQIRDFINGDILDQSILPEITQSVSAIHLRNGQNGAGDNSHAGGGDNSHAGGGDNSHAGGGDNSHAGGGDNSHADGEGIDQRFRNRQNQLRLFSEPDEGIKVEGKILLGYECLSRDRENVMPWQIDGNDDYLLRYQRDLDKISRRIFRNENGYPSLDIRKNIITRLSSFYSSRPDEPLRRGDEVYHTKFMTDNSAAEGVRPVSFGHGNSHFNIDAEKNELLVRFDQHYLQNYYSPLRTEGTGSPLRQKFKISFEDNFKTVKLDNGRGLLLKCDNKHYLKLVCKNTDSGVGISISLNDSSKGQMFYRYTHIKDDGKIDHHYGTITRRNRDPRSL